VIGKDADTFKVSAAMKALGGTFGLAYINADLDSTALGAVMYNTNLNAAGLAGDMSGTYEEIDFTYKTKVFNDSTTLFAGYVYQTDDRYVDEEQNFMRFWARYNF